MNVLVQCTEIVMAPTIVNFNIGGGAGASTKKVKYD